MNKYLSTCLALILMASMVACGSDSTTTSTDDTSTSILTNVFPSELSVSSPTAQTSSSSALSASSIEEITKSVASSSYATKKAAVEALLAATTSSSCTFTLNLSTDSSNASCYGPTMTYSNHPNATPAKKDDNTTDDDPEDGDGTLPSNDLGIWRSTVDGSTEACSAGQINKKVEGVANQVDSAILAFASMICLAQADGLTLPIVGDTLDLTSVVSTGFSTNAIGLTITSASISRDADAADGFTVYTSNLVGTSGTQTVTARLKHVANSDNSLYRGKLSFTVANTTNADPQNCTTSTATGETDAVSIAYEKSSATSLTYELHSGNFCGDSANPYASTTNFTVDPTKKLSSTNQTGWANNFNVAKFNINPSDGAGNYQFAWQAGAGDGNTRVMNAFVDATGALPTGRAYFGYGPDVESGAGAIDRMICNWAGPGAPATGSKTGSALAQRQLITQNSSGIFTVDSENITYAPTNDCDSDGTDGAGRVFTFTDELGNAVNTAVTNDLIAVTDVSITAPPTPAEVD
jgi:hypothetical protein